MDGRSYDWLLLEDQLGRGFPSDYKVLMERFGGFEIGEFIAVNSPEGLVAQNYELRDLLMKRPWGEVEVVDGRGFTGVRADGGRVISFSDVVQWADTDSDFSFCWVAEGHPDSWEILITDFHEWRIFPADMFSFLENLTDPDFSDELCRDFGWPSIGASVRSF